MFHARAIVAACIAVGVVTGGCTSQTANPKQYSGFLSSYSGLAESRSASDKAVIRWQDPNFKLSNYSNLIYRPLTFYPAPAPTEQIDNETLTQLLDYANQRLRAAMGERAQLVQEPGPRTLIFRGAITGVDTANEGLKPYQVIPVALVVSSATAASGARTRNTELLMEVEFIDAGRGKPVLKVVRKGFGKQVDNASIKVTVDDLKGSIDAMVEDVRLFDR